MVTGVGAFVTGAVVGAGAATGFGMLALATKLADEAAAFAAAHPPHGFVGGAATMVLAVRGALASPGVASCPRTCDEDAHHGVCMFCAGLPTIAPR